MHTTDKREKHIFSELYSVFLLLTELLDISSLFNSPSRYWKTEHCKALLPIFRTNCKVNRKAGVILAHNKYWERRPPGQAIILKYWVVIQ